MLAASSCVFQKSTLSALRTSSLTPDWRETISGTPRSMASSATIPKGSLALGMTKTSAREYSAAACSRSTKPLKRSLRARPSSALRSIRAGS